MTISEVVDAVAQIVSSAFYVHTRNGSIYKLYKDNHSISHRYGMINGISAKDITYINNDREEIG
jgi:hypothetical protein|tara:strand:+ start:350 stop:541 length:192 start_codon:yes stop_codon:yes gene_type:complete